MNINKKDYDNVQLAAPRLNPGGHLCTIKSITEGKSKTGKEMLTIFFDTSAEDPQPFFYSNDYISQPAMGKKWHGTAYIVMGTDFSLKNLKQFVTAVEDSNEGFVGVTDEGNVKLQEMAGKPVGIVFGEEEYLANTGRVGTSVKPKYFCNKDKVFEQPVPEKKLLEGQPVQQSPFSVPSSDPALANEGFMQVPEGNQLELEGLPFH